MESGDELPAASERESLSFARDVGFVGAAQLGASLLQFVRLPILTKELGVDLFGTWSLILVTVSLLTPLA